MTLLRELHARVRACRRESRLRPPRGAPRRVEASVPERLRARRRSGASPLPARCDAARTATGRRRARAPQGGRVRAAGRVRRADSPHRGRAAVTFAGVARARAPSARDAPRARRLRLPPRAARARTFARSRAGGTGRRRPRPSRATSRRDARACLRSPSTRGRRPRRPLRLASSSKPPAKTASRRSSSCSSGSRRSWLHWSVAVRVCCRVGAAWLPLRSRRNRSSSRAAIAAGLSAPSRAAASSRASGSPSRRRQIRATSSAFCSLSSKPGEAATARATNSETDA